MLRATISKIEKVVGKKAVATMMKRARELYFTEERNQFVSLGQFQLNYVARNYSPGNVHKYSNSRSRDKPKRLERDYH